jgi:peptidoglycan/LPS O-acetylase OafA/YrhL
MINRGERYRPEIDGLRAIAITASVFFHVRAPGFAGGFAGVDIFFVISGFLITRILLAELGQSGKIDFLAFYARRIRRLLPALVAVVTAALLLGTFILTAAGERQDLSISAAATIAFVSNFYFWKQQAHYFAGPADWLPLLNMWTLSVEEQFYAVWPALLVLASTITQATGVRKQAIIAGCLIALFAGSIAVFVWGAQATPTAAFYLTLTRMWEFALGGALALTENSLHGFRRIAGLATSLGLGAIAFSIVFPPRMYSITIVLAVFGAAAVIGSLAANPKSRVPYVLATRPLVIVGKLSYSWYLWHWPLLALARVHDFGQDNLARDLLVVFGALGLSALTYRYIENPIRHGRPWPFSSTRHSIAAGAGLSIGTAALALALYMLANAAMLRDPWVGGIYAARSSKAYAPPGCHMGRSFSELPSVQFCSVGAARTPPRILLWGDSHAAHLVEMISADGARNGYAAIARTMSGCPPMLPTQRNPFRLGDICPKFNGAVAREIPSLVRAGVTGIVLGSRLYGWGGPNAGPADMADWTESLRAVLSLAQQYGVRVLVTAPVPTFKFPVPECLAHLTTERCGIERAALDRTRRMLVDALGSVVAEFENARLWDPADLFCDANLCVPVRGGVILYSDWSHLTVLGSRGLAAVASPQLDWLRE